MAGTFDLVWSAPAAVRWCYRCGQSRQFTDYVYQPVDLFTYRQPFVERRCPAGHVDGDIQPADEAL